MYDVELKAKFEPAERKNLLDTARAWTLYGGQTTSEGTAVNDKFRITLNYDVVLEIYQGMCSTRECFDIY